jgi:hypothetical protein
MRMVNVNPAGTHAVASELFRRDIRCRPVAAGPAELELTSDVSGPRQVHIAAKQRREWPLVDFPMRPGTIDYLVFVDFEEKKPTTADGAVVGPSDRPDFYVLDIADWQQLTPRLEHRKVLEQGVPKYNLRREDLPEEFLERWDKFPPRGIQRHILLHVHEEADMMLSTLSTPSSVLHAAGQTRFGIRQADGGTSTY